ncbi:MAG: LptF/LptG family permease [Ignavibacteriales bacterium]
MRYAERLIGKGLSVIIIIKLITYNLAWMVVLVVPMAVLVSTLMAFGSMAQNNEIAIMKATGISLYKMLVPPFFASVIIAVLLIQFNNHVYPNANHAARVLGQDISRKKPALSLVPGVFSQDVPPYSILVRDIDNLKNELYWVTIYDNSDFQNPNIITAKKAKLYFSKSQDKLIMDLWNGEIHTSNISTNKTYRKIVYEKHKIIMNSEEFSFKESSSTDLSRGDREMSADDMLQIVDSLAVLKNKYLNELKSKITVNISLNKPIEQSNPSTSPTKKQIYRIVEDKITNTKYSVNASLSRLIYNNKSSNKYWVEIHKKYALPVACIVFILIGAPLGMMTRKGGFGVAAGISLIFFLIYWSFLIGGEKLADRGLLSPFWGMWSANFFLGILGIWLTIKSARESVTLDFSFLSKLIPKTWRQPREND